MDGFAIISFPTPLSPLISTDRFDTATFFTVSSISSISLLFVTILPVSNCLFIWVFKTTFSLRSPLLLVCLLNDSFQFIRIKRFCNVMIGSKPHGSTAVGTVPCPVRIITSTGISLCLNPLQRFHAIEPGHVKVKQQHIIFGFFQKFYGLNPLPVSETSYPSSDSSSKRISSASFHRLLLLS